MSAYRSSRREIALRGVFRSGEAGQAVRLVVRDDEIAQYARAMFLAYRSEQFRETRPDAVVATDLQGDELYRWSFLDEAKVRYGSPIQ